MKRMNTYLSMLLLAVVSMLSLTSCDDDSEIAYDLNGTWVGTIQGNRYDSRHNSWLTEITFEQRSSFSRGGTGYEYDLNRSTGTSYESYFDWSVKDRNIYIHYHSDNYNVVIRDWNIDWFQGVQIFSGTFVNTDTGEVIASFSLSKQAGYNAKEADVKFEQPGAAADLDKE